jgi:myo-inositol-1(or 4)-monophosphatase
MEKYVKDSLTVIERTLRRLRPELLRSFGAVEHSLKSDLSVVTDLDKRVETQLKDALRPLDASVGFYGEEFGQEGSDKVFWTIDPIDGTEAFIRGMPFCTNMLCLISDGMPEASLIYNFVLDELFIAVKGKGATLNGIAISVSNRSLKHGAIEYETKAASLQNRESYFTAPTYMRYVFSVAGYGFCQVAKGAIEARIQNDAHGKIWDFAPGALLVKEAGGRVININSDSYDYKNLNFIASNQVVFDELMAHFS